MTFKITVVPSNHTFPAEPSESLLDAGLRAGLNLDHSCSSGACGQCKARLIAGEISPIRHTDYIRSARERERGVILLCSNRAEQDLVIEAHEAGSAAEIPRQQIRAKVAKVERLQDDVVQLTVRTPRSSGLKFLAGQSVAVCLPDLPSRELSIASCPCDPVQLRFHLRRRTDDTFSDYVFDGLRRSAEIELIGPCGEFTLNEESERALVMIAWESGFAAISSVIDHAIQKDENRSIDLYWLSAIPRGHYLSNYCRAWQDVLDDFRYHSIDLQPTGEDRLLDVVERALRVHSLLSNADYYLAIPRHAESAVRSLLAQAEIADDQVRITCLDSA